MPALTMSPDLPRPGVDWRLLGFLTVLTAGCAMAFALVPALRSTRLTLTVGLQESSRRGTAGPERRWLAGSLIVAQIALSLVLVVTAALLVRSIRNLDHADLGFDASHVLTFKLDPSLNGYPPERVRALRETLLERLRHAPGVVAASFTSHPLLSNQSSIGVAEREDEATPDPGSPEAQRFRQEHAAWRQNVSPGFFATLNLPIVRGRAIDERDVTGGPRVAVVNRLLARQLFKTDDVVGRRFRLGLRQTSPVYEIVGVAGDALYTAVRHGMPPTVYLAASQQSMASAAFEIRTAGEPGAFAPTAIEIARQIDDQVPLVGVRALTDQIVMSLRRERLFARLALLLGIVTLSLCAIGLYGLLSYGVAQRVPEIGVRMALGAAGATVRWMVLRQSLWLAAGGLVFGAGAALLVTKTVESVLYELPPHDPVTLAVAATIMLATCLFAAYVPARRASRVDPVVALRAE
jgi:predicted permease